MTEKPVLVLLRSPEDSVRWAQQLIDAGVHVHLLPLLDYERVSGDQGRIFGSAMRELAEDRFAWLALTSQRSVEALHTWASEHSMSMAKLVGATQVGVVGDRCAEALEMHGITPSLVAGRHAFGAQVRSAPSRPTRSDAAGLAQEFGDLHSRITEGLEESSAAHPPRTKSTRILLPASSLAPTTFATQLQEQGWQVSSVCAYHTVRYPARAERRLAASDKGRMLALERLDELGVPVIDAHELGEQTREALAHRPGEQRWGVLVSSPSAVRWFWDALETGSTRAAADSVVDALQLIALGTSTARALQERGVHGFSVAPTPDVPGVLEAFLRPPGDGSEREEASPEKMRDR